MKIKCTVLYKDSIFIVIKFYLHKGDFAGHYHIHLYTNLPLQMLLNPKNCTKSSILLVYDTKVQHLTGSHLTMFSALPPMACSHSVSSKCQFELFTGT